MKTCTVITQTFFNSRHRRVGDLVALSDEQAERLIKGGLVAEGDLTPEGIEAYKAELAKPKAKAPAKKSKSGDS